MMTRVAITVEPEIIKKIDDLKWILKMTRSELIRNAIKSYIKNKGK